MFYYVIGVLVFNAVARMVRGASMHHSLKLVQLLQINEILPLFNVHLPSFVLVFYETISYANWQISDKKGIYARILGLKTPLQAYNFNFKM